MAFAITNKTINVAPDWVAVGQSTDYQFVSTATSTSVNGGAGSRYFEYADYTATGPIPLASQVSTGTIGDFGGDYRNVRGYVYLKAYTSTSTTAVPVVILEAATSTGYSPVYMLDSKTLYHGTSTSPAAVLLWGNMPILGGARYARINFRLEGTTSTDGAPLAGFSTGLDAIIQAV